MKNFLLVGVSIFLVAAGCNFSKPSTIQKDYQSPSVQNPTNPDSQQPRTEPSTPQPDNNTSLEPQPEKEKFCAQVITPAKNTQTGEVKNFPTSCLPEGWVAMYPNVTQ